MAARIGVVLGSGAARGWAHIGVLQALAELGIRPAVVCGTSIGALVGAAFVTGRLETLTSRMKEFGRGDVARLLDPRLARGGLIEGRRIDAFLESLGIEGAIESLNFRFGAVATDLVSGREVWLQSGPIGHAVRASIGMPGVFSPVRHDEAWLVDGGLVDPVPVSLARALGADIVIAVDLNARLLGRRLAADAQAVASEPAALPSRIPQWLKKAGGPLLAGALESGPGYPSYFEVLANTLNIMQDRITRARLAGDPPDILLQPILTDFSWFDFHRASDAIAEGVACVESAQVALRRACKPFL